VKRGGQLDASPPHPDRHLNHLGAIHVDGDLRVAVRTGKRDRLRAALAGSGFRLPPAAGTYFQLLDFSALDSSDDNTFAERLLTEAGVATIPLSPFYAVAPRLTVVRLCIAKRDATLDEGAARLTAFAQRLDRT